MTHYSDPDNNAPEVITVNVSGYSAIDLLEVNQLDSVYSDGKEYYYNSSGFSVGSYTFHYAANDTMGDWVESIALQFDVLDRNPILSNGVVSQTSGFMDTMFNFTVVYTDPDNQVPNTIVVNISGLGSYALFEVDPISRKMASGNDAKTS